MKISVIGAGNVGSTLALRLLHEGFKEITLVDKIPGMATARAFDLEDAQGILRYNYNIRGTDDIAEIKNSDIIVITAGLPRKPGMTREELLGKNAQIVREVCLEIKKLSPEAIVIVITNPLDLMTYLALKVSGFKANKIIGMGISLDASRFANLISKELNIPAADIEACVIGSHGEGMLPLVRLSKIKGVALSEFIGDKKTQELIARTINRGAELVSLSGSGSAYFAPSAAAAGIVKAIAEDQKNIQGACACLNGEYGLRDICIGVPCRLGKIGIEKILELDLNKEEKEALTKAADSIRRNIDFLKPYLP